MTFLLNLTQMLNNEKNKIQGFVVPEKNPFLAKVCAQYPVRFCTSNKIIYNAREDRIKAIPVKG